MTNDWRLRIDLHESGIAHRLTEHLEASHLEHDLRDEFHDRVAVSRDGGEVFCYAETREQASRARELIGALAEQHGWTVELELRRWHPVAEEWEDPDAAVPDSESERTAEHRELLERERADAAQQGYPDFEVRIDAPRVAPPASSQTSSSKRGCRVCAGGSTC